MSKTVVKETFIEMWKGCPRLYKVLIIVLMIALIIGMVYMNRHSSTPYEEDSESIEMTSSMILTL